MRRPNTKGPRNAAPCRSIPKPNFGRYAKTKRTARGVARPRAYLCERPSSISYLQTTARTGNAPVGFNHHPRSEYTNPSYRKIIQQPHYLHGNTRYVQTFILKLSGGSPSP